MAPRLVILSADYGGKDVTEIVQKAADKFFLSLLVSNENLDGDPSPGKGKTLTVKWQLGAASGTEKAREGRTLTIRRG